MNVDDTTAPVPAGDRLEMMFNRQKELFEKYGPIEKSKGVGFHAIVHNGFFAIDDAQSQYILKDYAWRVTEELMEMLSCDEDDPLIRERHAAEELADALHFFIELFIVARLEVDDVVQSNVSGLPTQDRLEFMFRTVVPDSDWSGKMLVERNVLRTVRYLGLSMNCLKNKPWKQTQIPTDYVRVLGYLREAFHSLITVADAIGLDSNGLYDFYFRKANVNAFRQRSNY